MMGVFCKVERKSYPEESLVLWSTIDERPIEACFMQKRDGTGRWI